MVFGKGRRGFLKKTPSPGPHPAKTSIGGEAAQRKYRCITRYRAFHVETALPNEESRRPLQRHKSHLAALSNAGTSVSYTLILYNFKVKLL